MTDFVTMRTRIKDEYVNESLTDAQVNAAIQSAIAHYQRERFYFNESRTETFSTVANQEYYGSADNANIPNLSQIDSLTITTNGVRYPLNERSWDWIEDVSSTDTTIGQPTDYCYYAGNIRLYSIPDAAYSVRIAGLIRFAALSNDTDTNAWMVDGEELIRNRAKWDLALNILHAEDIAARAEAARSVAYAALKDETRRRIVSDGIRPWGV